MEGDLKRQGYPVNIFKEDVGESFKCLKCKLVVRDPCYCSSCGEEYCKTCAEDMKRRREVCGNRKCKVNEPLKAKTSTNTKIKLNKKACFCLNKNEGCTWEGELGNLDQHLNSDKSTTHQQRQCQYEKVKCTIKGCREMILRRNLDNHQSQNCLYRPYKCVNRGCTYSSSYRDVTESHSKVCQFRPVVCRLGCGETLRCRDQLEHEDNVCRNYDIECDVEGCTKVIKRKDLALHKETDAIHHVDILSRELRQARMLIETIKRRLPEEPSKILPVTLTVDKFIQLKHVSDPWMSDILYTEQGGYALHIIVDPHGRRPGPFFGEISVHLYVSRGEFDDELTWPCGVDITVELLNQQNDQDHYSKTVRVRGSKSIDNRGYGWNRYICIKQLEPLYLKDNCLKFKVKLT